MGGFGGGGASHEMEPAGKFQFVKKETRGDSGDAGGNMASKFAGKALRSESAKADGQLQSDFASILNGEAIYLPHFHCARKDFARLAGLARDMEEHGAAAEVGGMIEWSKHLKHEDPHFSPTFQRIVEEMSAHFDVEVYATRLNFYRDGTDWKPFHQDSHAFGGREKREDFTMGASFGGERELAFLHEPSGQQFSFPQNNGDVFAFTTEVNKRFKHGVPKLVRGVGGPRFSIIAWGRRRTINANNGGSMPRRDGDGAADGGWDREAAAAAIPPQPTVSATPGKVNELVMGSGDVSELIKTFLLDEERREQQLQQRRERPQRQQQGGGGGGGGRGGGGGGRGGGGRDSGDGRRGGGSGEGVIGGNREGDSSDVGLGGGARHKAQTPTAVAAAAAAATSPPATPRATTRPTVCAPSTNEKQASTADMRGSMAPAAALRTSLGDDAYVALRAAARGFQRGETTVDVFYSEAVAACGGCWGPVVELAGYVPSEAHRAALLGCHARREFGGG